MKSASTELKNHFGQDCTTLAVLWKVSRTDGVVMGFTTHDRDIVYNGVTYAAATGFTPSAVNSGSDMSPDNLEVTGFLDSSALDENDIRAGKYNNATVEERVVNWNDLTMGDVIIRSGTVGNITMKNGLFTAELRGLTQKLSTLLGSSYGPVCRAELGSSVGRWPCGVDISLYVQTGSVASTSNPSTFTPSAGLVMRGSATPTDPAPAGWFADGLVTFTSGNNNGLSAEIKSWDGTIITLFLGLPYELQSGDTFTIEPGCNHTLADCRDKFNNVVNFKGEPFIPGMDVVLNYPNARS